MLMIMENMIQMGYLLLIMCCVFILIAMVTQLHKKDLKEAFNQQLYFSKKLLQFDESIIQECPLTTQARRRKVKSKSEKKMKMKPPGITKKVLFKEPVAYGVIYDEVEEVERSR